MSVKDMGAKELSRAARCAELLDVETERALAEAWRDHRDERAMHRLIMSHMRLAISMAAKFRRYGAPMSDLIQEAGLGLMTAADKFDPDRGVRFSTYAMWWIRAAVQDYVMRNWSMVRTGTTAAQKTLFFNLRRVQARLEGKARADGDRLPGSVLRERIAEEVGVALRDVEMMQGRLAGADFSLNAVQSVAEEGREWIDALEDKQAQTSETVAQNLDTEQLREWLLLALQGLESREQLIVRERRLTDKPRTLESLGRELKLSKERVRQLEVTAFGKMRAALVSRGAEVHHFLS